MSPQLRAGATHRQTCSAQPLPQVGVVVQPSGPVCESVARLLGFGMLNQHIPHSSTRKLSFVTVYVYVSVLPSALRVTHASTRTSPWSILVVVSSDSMQFPSGTQGHFEGPGPVVSTPYE
jgi:hypothetical protein